VKPAPTEGAATNGGGPIRFAAVSYVNAWPLLRGLEEHAGVSLITTTPARVADLLAAGQVDVGLVPSIELLRQETLRPLGGIGISAFGPVDSVLVLLRRAPHRVRTLALDPASRTSQVLATLVLGHVFGVVPELVVADPGEAWASGACDAVLVIGDRALEFRRMGVPALDLADAWTRWTSLPFVFAVWGATPCVEERGSRIESLLAESLARGRRDLGALAGRAAMRGPLDEAGFEVYLSRRIRYGLGASEMRGLRMFLDLARTTECST
jgi:predicted solute-binding protein